MITIEQISKIGSKKALRSFLEKNYRNDPEKLIDDISASLNTLLATNLKQSARYLKKAEQIFKYLPENFRPRLLAMQGRLAHWSGQPKSAVKKYEQSCKLFKKFGNKMAEMRTGVGLMDVHMYLGNYSKALKVGKTSLAYFKRNGENILAANTMINLGNVYHRMDRNNQALNYYDQARDIYYGKDEPRLAMAEYNRANIYANLFQLDKAKELYRKASEIYKKLGMELNHTKSEYSLTYLEFLTDNYATALNQFEKIYDEFIRLGDVKSASVTQLDLVELHLHLNQFGAASMVAEELVTQFAKLGMNYEQGKAQYFAAEASIRIGDYAKAAGFLSDAKRTFAKENNLLWLGMVSNARSRLYLKRKKFVLAEAEIKKALVHFIKSGDERRTMDARITQLESQFTRKPSARLVKLTQQILKRPLASYQRFHLECMLGQHFLDIESFEKALRYCKSSIDTLEMMLTGLYPDEVRYYFLEDKTVAFTSTVDCLLKLNRTDEGFTQNLQMMSAVNQRPAVIQKMKRDVAKDLNRKIKTLRANLKNLNIGGQLGQRKAGLQVSYRTLEQKLWQSEQKLRSTVTDRIPIGLTDDRSLDSAVKNIPKGAVLINYSTTGGRLGVFCSHNDKTEFIPLQIRHNELERLVRELEFTMENSIHSSLRQSNFEAAEFYLSELLVHLIEPIKTRIKGREVILLVDGLFAQIPWPGLFKNDQYLNGEQANFRIISNPLDLENIRKKPGGFAGRKNAVFAVTSETLPSVETEAAAICSFFDKATLFNAGNATTANLSEALAASEGFVHLATHASRSSENPLFSRILMTDGPFFPFDLFQSGVNAQLVTLSGCQTAAPGLYYGNSFSLAKSFMQAGSRFVLGTLWSVRDNEIFKFMNHFYANLKVTENVFDSYNFALEKTKEETKNPAVWSSFVLWGL